VIDEKDIGAVPVYFEEKRLCDLDSGCHREDEALLLLKASALGGVELQVRGEWTPVTAGGLDPGPVGPRGEHPDGMPCWREQAAEPEH
jgi:hypothetical protein